MATRSKARLALDRAFDAKACRHYLNNNMHVLHCHHYATLYCQLADDCSILDAKKLLADCAEDAIYDVLSGYFAANGIDGVVDRIAIAEQYFSAAGMGRMVVVCAGPDGGDVEFVHSHVDEGWIKKWGQRDEAVNFIGLGFVAAVFAAAFGRPVRSYAVTEVQSIVAGAERSVFQVVAN